MGCRGGAGRRAAVPPTLLGDALAPMLPRRGWRGGHLPPRWQLDGRSARRSRASRCTRARRRSSTPPRTNGSLRGVRSFTWPLVRSYAPAAVVGPDVEDGVYVTLADGRPAASISPTRRAQSDAPRRRRHLATRGFERRRDNRVLVRRSPPRRRARTAHLPCGARCIFGSYAPRRAPPAARRRAAGGPACGRRRRRRARAPRRGRLGRRSHGRELAAHGEARGEHRRAPTCCGDRGGRERRSMPTTTPRGSRSRPCRRRRRAACAPPRSPRARRPEPSRGALSAPPVESRRSSGDGESAPVTAAKRSLQPSAPSCAFASSRLRSRRAPAESRRAQLLESAARRAGGRRRARRRVDTRRLDLDRQRRRARRPMRRHDRLRVDPALRELEQRAGAQQPVRLDAAVAVGVLDPAARLQQRPAPSGGSPLAIRDRLGARAPRRQPGRPRSR